MGDDDPPHAGLDRAVDDGEDLVAREVAGGEDEVVAGDRAQHLARLGQQVAVLVDDGHRLGDDAGLAQLELEAHPHRDLAAGIGGEHLVLLVDRADGREPHDPRALARGDLERDRVQAADGAVEHEGAEHVDLGDRLADHAGALGRRGVVRLEAEAGEPELGEAVGEREVADAPLDDVRGDVDVDVVAAADDLAGALGGDGMAVAHAPHARRATSATSRSLRSWPASSSG